MQVYDQVFLEQIYKAGLESRFTDQIYSAGTEHVYRLSFLELVWNQNICSQFIACLEPEFMQPVYKVCF